MFAQVAHDIEVTVSSTQIASGVGVLILLLLAIIGWLVRAEWQSVNKRLGSIETNTNDLPSLKERVARLEERVNVLSKRSHNVTNVLAVLMHGAGMKQIDFDKEV